MHTKEFQMISEFDKSQDYEIFIGPRHQQAFLF